MLEKDVRDFFFKTKENYQLVAGHKELYIDGLRIDIFAVDKQGNPFIIEFKKDKNRHIVGQSAHYLALIPARQGDIEKKLNYFNINWKNLKVLCIAKAFNQRDFDALNFEPIKDRVFLYQYAIIKDYREKAIFGIDLIYTGSNISPLYIPPKPTSKLDFKEHFTMLLSLEGKESKRQYYTSTILPLLDNVSVRLAEKFGPKGVYPHISYFNSTHILFRLNIDKKQSHRASVSITFNENIITSGFNLTHSLQDAIKLRVLLTNKSKIAARFLTLEDYSLYVPNCGIAQSIPLSNMNLKGIKLLLNNFDPKVYKDCYFIIDREYEHSTMTENDIIELFESEYNNFNWLLHKIKDNP